MSNFAVYVKRIPGGHHPPARRQGFDTNVLETSDEQPKQTRRTFHGERNSFGERKRKRKRNEIVVETVTRTRNRRTNERTNTSEHSHMIRDGEKENRKRGKEEKRTGEEGSAEEQPHREACYCGFVQVGIESRPIAKTRQRLRLRAVSEIRLQVRTASPTQRRRFIHKEKKKKIITANLHFCWMEEGHEEISDNQKKRHGDLLYSNSSGYTPSYTTRRISLYWST